MEVGVPEPKGGPSTGRKGDPITGGASLVSGVTGCSAIGSGVAVVTAGLAAAVSGALAAAGLYAGPTTF